MKIVYKNESSPTDFCCLDIGDVFEYEGETYMKCCDERETNFYAVCLECGIIYSFNNGEKVIPKEAILTIK